MRAASREALAQCTAQLDAVIDAGTASQVRALGEQLFAVVELLAQEIPLRRHLADSTAAPTARQSLLESLLGGKVDQSTMDILHTVVTASWSEPNELLDGVERLSRLALLSVAQKDGTLAETEDELFRFGRIIESQSELRNLLTDPTTPIARRIDLLRQLIGQKVHPATLTLLEQTVSLPRGRSLDVVAGELAELAASRRDRYVAYVSSVIPLSASQEEQLVAALQRIYRREMSLHVETDPRLLGGMVIRVGDEVIDGSVSHRLDETRHRLVG